MSLIKNMWKNNSPLTKKIIALRLLVIFVPIAIFSFVLAITLGNSQSVKIVFFLLLGLLTLLSIIAFFVYKYGVPKQKTTLPSWAPILFIILGILQLIFAAVLYVLAVRELQLIIAGILCVVMGLYLRYGHRES